MTDLERRLGYEFDMLQNRWDQSLSPGNERFWLLLAGIYGTGADWAAVRAAM